MENTLPVAAPINPLLAHFRLPGTTVRMPSRGMFYNNGELTPDVVDGEVTIYPMTLEDDITIRSIDKLFNGEAVTEVFSRCIPQVLHPTKLLSKDVDYLILRLRHISYGDEVDVKFKHNCPEAKSHDYTVNIERDLVPRVKSVDPTAIGAVQKITLSTGQVVAISPTRFENFIKLLQANEEDNIPQAERVKREVNAITGVIQYVTTPHGENVTNADFIGEWLKKLPNLHIRQIITAVEKVSDWGVDLTHTTKCRDCDQVITFDVPFNPINFFM